MEAQGFCCQSHSLSQKDPRKAETVAITLLYARAKSVSEYNQAQILLFMLYQWLKNQMEINYEY